MDFKLGRNEYKYKIEIESDGKRITRCLIVDTEKPVGVLNAGLFQRVAEGVAKCAPDDTFDFFKGAKLALERAEVEFNKYLKVSNTDKWEEFKKSNIILTCTRDQIMSILRYFTLNNIHWPNDVLPVCRVHSNSKTQSFLSVCFDDDFFAFYYDNGLHYYAATDEKTCTDELKYYNNAMRRGKIIKYDDFKDPRFTIKKQTNYCYIDTDNVWNLCEERSIKTHYLDNFKSGKIYITVLKDDVDAFLRWCYRAEIRWFAVYNKDDYDTLYQSYPTSSASRDFKQINENGKVYYFWCINGRLCGGSSKTGHGPFCDGIIGFHYCQIKGDLHREIDSTRS